jgi:hypothetical protein
MAGAPVRTLLNIAILTVVAFTLGGWRAPRVLLSANDRGDTVWFAGPVMWLLPKTVRMGVVEFPVDSSVLHAAAYARSADSPVLIMMEDRDPTLATDEILARGLRHPLLGLRDSDPPDGWGIHSLEAGRFDNFEGHPLYGWEMAFPRAGASAVRLVFIAIGPPRSPPDSLIDRREATGRHWLRPFEIPIPDRLRTVRVIGDYRADLVQNRFERVESSK